MVIQEQSEAELNIYAVRIPLQQSTSTTCSIPGCRQHLEAPGANYTIFGCWFLQHKNNPYSLEDSDFWSRFAFHVFFFSDQSRVTVEMVSGGAPPASNTALCHWEVWATQTSTQRTTLYSALQASTTGVDRACRTETESCCKSLWSVEGVWRVEGGGRLKEVAVNEISAVTV